MKLVRQLVKRESAAEGWKNVGDEYPVSAARAKELEAKGLIEIIGDVTKSEAAELAAEEAAPPKASKTAPSKRRSS